MKTLRPLLAEFIGIFFLVFAAAGVIVANAYRDGAVGFLGIAAAQGIALAVAMTATAGISGGHLNPALTVGMLSVGRISARTAALYVVAQLLGAAAAAFAIKGLYPDMAGVVTQLGTPRLANDVSVVQGILIESILTFFLAFAWVAALAGASASRSGGFAVGMTLFFCVLAGGHMTGAALNPGRAFGPALAANAWTAHAVYWIGPVLGSVAAMQVCERFLLKQDA